MNELALQVNSKDLDPIFESAKGFFDQFDKSIEQIEVYIDSELDKYTVEKIGDDFDGAKKARAKLNQGAKDLNSARLALEKEWLKPFDERKVKVNDLKKKIEGASFEIDTVIKCAETKAKEIKLAQCKEFWRVCDFDIVDFEQVFNEKWLNATFKQKDIQTEMNAKIEKIKSELKMLERFGDDAEELKAFYLIDLSIEKAIEKADSLKLARERAEKERAERAEREHREAIQEQQKEILEEEKHEEKTEVASSLAMEALGLEEEEKKVTFTLEFTVTLDEKIKIKQFFTNENILYKQVQNQ